MRDSSTNSGKMLFAGAMTLLGVGVAMVYSSSAILAMHHYQDSLYFFKRQVLWSILGMGGLFVGMRVDYRVLKRFSLPILIISILLLCLTLNPLFSREVNRARRWAIFGPISFQTSEFAKIALIIFIAERLSTLKERIKSFRDGFLPLACAVGLICGLILFQPHLGMSLLIFVVGMAMIFIVGGRPLHLGYLALPALPSFYLLSMKFDYARERIASFLNPWTDPFGGGYQIIQSLIALARGGLFGVGPGGSHAKLFYLPYPHTDFIFAIIGEELGFFLTLGVVGLFLWFGLWGMRIAGEAKDLFGALLAFGFTWSIVLQAILNMGVVTGIFPITGLPLPFISFGGSNLVCNLSSVGIMLSISRRSSLRGEVRCGY